MIVQMNSSSTVIEQPLQLIVDVVSSIGIDDKIIENDLLTHIPWLRRFLLSRWYPKGIWVAMMIVFVPVTALGFIGSQSRDSKIIYLWEKLWDLPHHADLSAWLLLTITAGAVIFSQIYERRLWSLSLPNRWYERYVCQTIDN